MAKIVKTLWYYFLLAHCRQVAVCQWKVIRFTVLICYCDCGLWSDMCGLVTVLVTWVVLVMCPMWIALAGQLRHPRQPIKKCTAQKATMHQVITMLATSKSVLFPSHNQLLTTSTDDLALWLSPKHQRGWLLKWRVISAGGYDLEIEHF